MMQHPFAPVYNRHSEILILGSFPSVKSREQHFYYGHPQNRFWRVLAAVYDTDVPQTIDERTAFLLTHRIALFDVLASCEITGSADSTIKNALPNDLSELLRTADIRRIFVNGKKAAQYYERYQRKTTGRDAIYLPSTSPANAAWSFDRLCDAWSIVRQNSGV